MANEREFTLVGKFDDQITKKLKAINEELSKLSKPLKRDNVASSLTKGFEDASKELKNLQKSLNSTLTSAASDVTKVTKGFTNMTGSLDDAAKSAGKVRDTVSQIGEGVKGLDSIGESLEAAARAAGRAQEEVAGIGNAAGRANGQAESLINTLLKAEALSKIGDGVAAGFSNGMARATNLAARGAGLIGKMFRESMEDELADVKAATGIQGSFGRAGYKGSFPDAQRTYKAFDREVSEMIKMSSAPTAKVIELQRYTLDTIGPLLMAAEGVQKGTAMKDIKPEAIQSAAKGYGALLEKVAILGQGTGSAGFRIAGGIEQLVTRGKIDTQLDFFTDNILLMQNLQDAGFMGRQGTGGGKLMGATDAERLKAMMEAFEKSMSGEATAAMATSLTGSMQALGDVITNPSAGILGMSVSFGKDTQKKVNATVKEIYAGRIAEYQHELKTTKNLSAERRKQLEISIQQAIKTRDQLTKEGEERITTPFQAFSFSFSKVVQALTDALNSVGPVWENFAVVAIEFSENALGPLADNLKAIASNMRAGKMGQAEGFGRIVGEIYKKIGEVMGDLATMLTSPTGAAAKVQSEFMKGFMSAFGENPEQLKKAREAINKGISALAWKIVDMLKSVIMSEELRPFVLLFFGVIFGPALISSVIAGVTPLVIMGMWGLFKVMFKKLGSAVLGSSAREGAEGAARGGLKSFLSQQGATAARAGAALPGMAKPLSLAGGIKMKGVSTLAAAMITLSTHSPKLQQAGQAVTSFGKRIPLLSVAFAGLDFASQKAQGKSTTQAGLSAGGGVVGGIAGAAIGQALIPIPGVGAVAGGFFGSFIGSWIGEQLANIGPKLGSAIAAIPEKLKPIWQSLVNFFTQTLPSWWNNSVSFVVSALSSAWESLVNFVHTLPQRILFGIGMAIGMIQNGWDSLVNFITVTIPNAWNTAVTVTVGAIQVGWSAIVNFITVTIPNAWNTAVNYVISSISAAWSNVSAFIISLPGRLSAAWAGLLNWLGSLPGRVTELVNSFVAKAASWAQSVGSALQSVGSSIVNWAKGLPGRVWASITGAAQVVEQGRQSVRPGTTSATAFGSDSPFMGTLGEAINFEMKNKPAGSHLVVANSSETIIPAARGLGSSAIIEALNNGFSRMISALYSSNQTVRATFAEYISSLRNLIQQSDERTRTVLASGLKAVESSIVRSDNKQDMGLNRINSTLMSTHRQTVSHLTKIEGKLGQPGIGGIGSGGAVGGVNTFTPLAKRFGLQLTSDFRPGDPGWHGANRARDYSNGVNTREMMAFAKFMIANYGRNLKELIYTPLGFSIKNGRVVRPPIAASTHYNHVHVAYAGGRGRPALFMDQQQAIAWEKKMIPPNLKVRSVTTNSSEAMGLPPSEGVMRELTGAVRVMSAVGGNLCALMGTNRSGADTAGSFTGDKAGLNQLMSIAKGAGFTGRAAAIMAAIAMAESGGNPRAHNRKPPDNSYGLWQINMLGALGPERRRQFGLSSNEELFDPATNARAAFSISGGGVNFRPWSVYTSGAYRKFLPALEHVAYALGSGSPAFFSSKASAEAWERKMIPSSLKVKTLTTNTGEMPTGGPTTINAPITIYQQPNQDAEQLASMVAYRIGLAVNELRNHA